MARDVDLWIAVVGLIAALGAALIARAPAFSPDARRRTSITRDVEMWKQLPEGPGRDAFAEHIAQRVVDLTKRRSRTENSEQVGLLATAILLVGWILLLASSAITGSTDWIDQVSLLLGTFGAILALAGFLLGAIGAGMAVSRSIRSARESLRLKGATGRGKALVDRARTWWMSTGESV